MSLQIYSKEYQDFLHFTKRQQKQRKIDRGFSIVILILGIVAIGLAIWPAVIWKVSTSKTLGAKVENQPVPESEIISQNPLLSADIQVVKDPDGFTYFTTTHAQSATIYQSLRKRPSQFYLTIPKLKIEKAAVRVDTAAFQKTLSHFPKSAIPGEIGNAFITGHSTLPIFYDPKNYASIFTKLPSLEVGDEVFVDMEGQTLKFVVQYTKAVDPQDLSVLAPISPKGRNLTLMTCVPPGISTKRLVVITSLI